MNHFQVLLFIAGLVGGVTLFNVLANWHQKRRTKRFIEKFRADHWTD